MLDAPIPVRRQLRSARSVKEPKMKKQIGLLVSVLLLALLVAAVFDRQRADPNSALRTAGARTFSSFDPPASDERVMPAQTIRFEQADLAQVLNLYGELSGRSIIRAGNLP